MQAFWDSLSLLQKILYCIAIPSTLVLLIQTVLLFLGWGDGGDGLNASDTSGLDLDPPGMDFDPAGADFNSSPADGMDMLDLDLPDGNSADGSNPADFGTLRLFTLQGVIAFLCVFGWSGIALAKTALPVIVSLLIAFALGLSFMFLVALLIRSMAKLTDDGSVSLRSALGRSGSVYLTVPAKGHGHGKVNITINGQFREYDAITEATAPIPTGMPIRVTDIRGDMVLVEPE